MNEITKKHFLNSKKQTWALALLLIFFMPAMAFSGSSITGEITNQGFGTIVVKDASGTEIKLNTGRETTYKPSDYRCSTGDTITAEYYEKSNRDGTSFLLAVKKVTLVKADPNRKEMTSPVEGTIEKAGRKWFQVSVPAVNKTIKFEKIRGSQFHPTGWLPKGNEKVIIEFKKIPSRWGKSYVYTITSMKLAQ